MRLSKANAAFKWTGPSNTASYSTNSGTLTAALILLRKTRRIISTDAPLELRSAATVTLLPMVRAPMTAAIGRIALVVRLDEMGIGMMGYIAPQIVFLAVV